MIDTLIYLFAFLFVLSLVVVVHEWGHFIVARLCGVKVTHFSVGFGRVLWHRVDKKGTQWQVCALPLGGYVKMLGDEDAASAQKADASKIKKEDRKYMFASQNLWKKSAIIVAGAGMNYVFAILVLAGVFFFVGKTVLPPVIGGFPEISVARDAGMKEGDRFTKINDMEIKEYADILRAVRVTEYGKDLTIQVLRDNTPMTFIIKPQYVGDTIPRVGIYSAPELMVIDENMGPFEALWESCKSVYTITVDTLKYLGQVLFGGRSPDDMRGPLGIAEASGDALKGGFLSLILFVVNISVAIGFMNLLPVPVLDGGHLVFYAVEGITRRPIPEKVQNALLWGGMTLLFGLLAFTMYLDVPRIMQRIFG